MSRILQVRSFNHYISSLGLFWDVMTKLMDVKLDLILHTDIYQFIEIGMRVGVSYIGQQ